MQDCLDTLYARSVSGYDFYDLTELMSSKDNIRLAYRNIKRNKGSKTAGTDKLTINDILHLSVEDVIKKVQAMFKWYEPQTIRRVFIPKGKGKTKPLGIPTIYAR